MIVVDASVILEALLGTPSGKQIVWRLRTEGETLHAPHLLDLEVAQVLRRYVQSGDLGAERAAESLDALAHWRIARYPHHHFISRIWDLRHNLTAYDAVYVVLAEVLGAPLLTCDGRLVKAPGHRARVELVRPFDTESSGEEE